LEKIAAITYDNKITCKLNKFIHNFANNYDSIKKIKNKVRKIIASEVFNNHTV